MTLWLTAPQPIAAIGISVSPPSLVLRGNTNKHITGTFTVSNPSRETVIYEITNDGLLPLMITPTTFLLAPHKEAAVTVEYQPHTSPTQQPTHSQTTLSVLGRPLTVQPTTAASGIKLPIIIQSSGHIAGVSTRSYDPFTIGIVILDGLLVLWLASLLINHFLRRSHAFSQNRSCQCGSTSTLKSR